MLTAALASFLHRARAHRALFVAFASLAGVAGCAAIPEDVAARSQELTCQLGTGNVTHHGGPVIPNVRVRVVFWGTGVKYTNEIMDFYNAITQSPYIDWLNEYHTGTQQIGRGSVPPPVTDPTPPPGSTVMQSQVEIELQRLILSGMLSWPSGNDPNDPNKDPNDLYMVYFPPGVTIKADRVPGILRTSCTQPYNFCGMHYSFPLDGTTTVYYGLIADHSSCGLCGPTDLALNNTTSTSSHELVEAITDPDPSNNNIGWLDTITGEIGDICQSSQDPQCGQVAVTVAGKIYTVQKAWSDLQNKCVFGPYQPPAEMMDPPQGSVLPGSSVTFSWTTGSGVSQYLLTVGNSVGESDIYAVLEGTATSWTVSGLPTDGRTLYVRLYSYLSTGWETGWQYRDYTYTAAVASPANIYSPAPGSTLTDSTVTFSWTTGSDVSQYDLYVGSLVGGSDIYAASQGLATSGIVSGLPTDGRTLYVRLWSLMSTGWQYRDYAYTAAVIFPANIYSPAPDSTLTDSTVTFSWTTGSGVSQYYLYVGDSVGGHDIYMASQGLATSGIVSGLPADGRTLYVRLWSLTSPGWQFRDYTYTAAVCDPRAGTHGQIWTDGSTDSQYVYHDGWCSVGHGLPAGCYWGTYYYDQYLVSDYCSSTGSNDSCYDPDAWWWVTCESLVDCVYSCSGQCVKADCDG